MKIPPLDIFRKNASSDLTWIEASFDAEAAKLRIKELLHGSDDEYIIFDQRINQVVAVVNSRRPEV